MNILKKYPTFKQLFLYGVIGGFSATLDSISFLMLQNLGLDIYITNFVSINIGICVSFILNTYFNFRVKDNLKRRAISFFIVGYMGMLLSMLILYIGKNILNISSSIIIKLFSVIVVAIFQFILNKFITYKG